MAKYLEYSLIFVYALYIDAVIIEINQLYQINGHRMGSQKIIKYNKSK